MMKVFASASITITLAPSAFRSTSTREMAFQRANSTFLRRIPFAQTTSIKWLDEFKMISTASAALIHTARLRKLKEPLQTTEATAETRAAKRMALGAPIQFSSGTTARQATAPPMRSAP